MNLPLTTLPLPGLMFCTCMQLFACQSPPKDIASSSANPQEDTAVLFKEIIDIQNWKSANLQQDPLPSHQPDTIDCSSTAFRTENAQLEIRTEFCNYAYIEFPALQSLSAGQPVELLLLHSGLWAPEEAEAHVAWFIGSELFWEAHLPIPSSSDFFYYEASLPIAIQKGDPIRIHLHNHGANDWKIGYFNVVSVSED